MSSPSSTSMPGHAPSSNETPTSPIGLADTQALRSIVSGNLTAISAFDVQNIATTALGVQNDATSFTLSDFTHTLKSANAGSAPARWMGVQPAELGAIFPNLGNFATRDLGFLAA